MAQAFNTAMKQLVSRISASQSKHTFQDLAKTWWENSAQDPLYLLNQVRVPFIRDGLLNSNLENVTNQQNIDKSMPLIGFKLLDIGCGVGFLSEPLARLGAEMTGIDPEPENINQGNIHKEKDWKISNRIEYICGHSSDLLPSHFEKYDGVIASEVIEHVERQEEFVETAVDLTKKNGSLFFSTLNRTVLSYITAIILAEKVLGIIPNGIHEWEKFVTPQELSKWLEMRGCEIRALHGIKYNPVTMKFHWCKDMSDNYMLHAIKRS